MLAEWIEEHGLTVDATANRCGIERERFRRILDGAPISAEDAVRLDAGTMIVAGFWLRAEAHYRADLEAGLSDLP
jgi:plasmid maintenance system antidote protein VapI